MSVVLLMGFISAVAGLLLSCAAVCLLGGLAEGIFVAHIGKRLGTNPLVRQTQPRLARLCRVLGILSTSICSAALLLVAFYLLSPILIRSAELYESINGLLLVSIMLILIVLGFLFFLAMGVIMIRISGVNKRAGQQVMHPAVSVVSMVLGVITFFAAGISLLIVVLVMQLFRV